MFIKNNRGYTLVEAGVVATVIAVLISATISIYMRAEKQGWLQGKSSAYFSIINIVNTINRNRGFCPALSDANLSNLGSASPLSSYFGSTNLALEGFTYTCSGSTVTIRFTLNTSKDISDGDYLLRGIMVNRLPGYTVSNVNTINRYFTVSWSCACA